MFVCVSGSISNIDDAEFHCNKTQVRKVISGVVGAASSVTSIQVANLLRLFKIPQVSDGRVKGDKHTRPELLPGAGLLQKGLLAAKESDSDIKFALLLVTALWCW